MFCPDCGKKIPDNSRFCTHCGADVGGTRPVREPEPEPQRVAVQHSKSKAVTILLIIAIVLLAAAITLMIYIIRNDSENHASASYEKEEEAEEDSEEEAEEDAEEEIDFEKEAEKLVRKYFKAVESGDVQKIVDCYHPDGQQYTESLDPCIRLITSETPYIVEDYSITEILYGEEAFEYLFDDVVDEMGMSTEELMQADLSAKDDPIISTLNQIQLYILTYCQKGLEEGNAFLLVTTDSEVANEDRSSGSTDFEFLICCDDGDSRLIYLVYDQYATAAAEPEASSSESSD